MEASWLSRWALESDCLGLNPFSTGYWLCDQTSQLDMLPFLQPQTGNGNRVYISWALRLLNKIMHLAWCLLYGNCSLSISC